MQTIPLYKYYREDGGVTVSPQKPECEYTQMYRVVADEGKLLKLPDGVVTTNADVDSVEGITEGSFAADSETTVEERLDEIEAAMIELAANQSAQEQNQAETEAALIELAALAAEEGA